jgi:pyruvate/2-oxoglutarate dehydrogenase complex dihydrolipoamide dehydrogenase (E3) component
MTTTSSGTPDDADGHGDGDHSVDVAVLGGGSGGERTAVLAVEAGMSAVVIESGLVGGECPFHACIPSKSMLRVAALRAAASRAHEIGASSDPLDVGDPDDAWAVAVARRDDHADQRDDTGHADDLADAGVVLLRGRGRLDGPGRIVLDDGTTVTATHVVLATGAGVAIPPIEGLEDVEAWTFVEAWSTTDRPASIVVVGGGAVGTEIAQTFARFGVAVTLVDRGELGGDLEPEVAADLADVLRADGVDVRLGVEVQRVRPGAGGGVVVTVDGDEVSAERLVLASGKRPRLEDLGLQSVGLDPEDGLDVDGRCRVGGVDWPTGALWAVGDVNGLAPFTHTANAEAAIAVGAMRGGDRTIEHEAVPRTIYTDPEVAAVGRTRQQAHDEGLDVAWAAFDLADTARAYVDPATAGRVVLVADRSSRALIGACLIGPSAGESIGEFALAVQLGVTADRLADVVHPFPTWSEGFGPAIDQLLEALDTPSG